MDNQLQSVLDEIVDELDARKISYALVGGLAASLHGRLRTTEDVDLIVLLDVHGALRFLHELNPAQFRPYFPEAETVLRQSFILALEHVVTGVTLDLAVGVSGFEQQIVRRAKPVEIAGRAIHIATAEDLIVMKTLAGRPQDEQDIAGIIQRQRDKLDWAYCLELARQLGEAVDMDLEDRILRLRDAKHL